MTQNSLYFLSLTYCSSWIFLLLILNDFYLWFQYLLFRYVSALEGSGLDWYYRLRDFKTIMPMKGIRMYHPKISYYDIRIIVSCNSRCRKSSLLVEIVEIVPIYLTIGHTFSLWSCPLSDQERRAIIITGVGDSTKMCLHKQHLTEQRLSSISFPMYLSPHNLLPIETQTLVCLFLFIFV